MTHSGNPQISVIMPAYNAADFVAEAVRSILAQTFAKFEIIIIEDRSTDSTRAIVKSFTDERILVAENPANLGEAASFNVGMELARGDFLARFDADDIAESNRLKVQYEFMIARPDVTICGSDVDCFGELTGLTDVPPNDGDIKANFMIATANIMNPTAFIRRKFIMERRCRANPDYAMASDLAFWIECMRQGAVFANIKKPLIRYRTRERNRGGQPNPALREILGGLALDFFPSLSRNEALDMVRIFVVEPMTLNSNDASRTVAACRKALFDDTSHFGENRTLLRQHVTNYAQRFINAVDTAIRQSHADARWRLSDP